jgi:hypothetical protein
LLFLIYANDIVENISSHISLFADDTSLYRCIKSIEDENAINTDLQTISEWGKRWRVQFNAQKTKYMIFSRRRYNRSRINISFDNVTLNEETSHKHLGIVFANDLSWRSHVESTVSSVSKRLNIMKTIQRKVPRICLESIYNQMILPIIEYGDVIYDNLPVHLQNELEVLQRQSALCCTNGYRHTKHDNLLIELGWTPLSIRRKYHRLILMYKIMNGLTPPYLKRILPSTVAERSQYNLRSRDNLVTVRYNKTFCSKSFIPATVKDWNEFSIDLRSCTSLHQFKIGLKTILFKNKNNIYKHISGPNVTHICRMRMGLSGLNKHRYDYNFIMSPMCNVCNDQQEDAVHYFFHCIRYAAQREILFNQLVPILGKDVDDIKRNPIDITNMLLNGCENYTVSLNKELFKVVQDYIGSTKRFI